VGEREPLNSFEKLLILRVGARPAALNNVDTDFVEFLSYRKLIVQGEGYTSSLGAVAESRVKNFNVIDSTTPAGDVADHPAFKPIPAPQPLRKKRQPTTENAGEASIQRGLQWV
jgi:hypothetical protein